MLSGVHDLNVAGEEFRALQLAPFSSTALTPEHSAAEYVRLRELNFSVEKLKKEGLTWKDTCPDSAAGILLQASNQKEISQLGNKLAYLERDVLKVCLK